MSNQFDLQPTRIRYRVIAVSTLMGILLYLDRFCIGIAEPFIRQDLGLTKQQMGIFMSAFFWPYALAQIPSGWLADRFGARKMMTIYILAWSFFTAMMGLANGFIMLVAMRAAYGLGQAGAYPTSSSIVSRWIPPLGRGAASSFIALGGRIGGAIAPVLTAILIVSLVAADKSPLLQSETVLNNPAILKKLSERDQKDQQAYLHVYNQSSAPLQKLVSSVRSGANLPASSLTNNYRRLDPAQEEEMRELIANSFNQLIEDPGFYSPRRLSPRQKHGSLCHQMYQATGESGAVERGGVPEVQSFLAGSPLSNRNRADLHEELAAGPLALRQPGTTGSRVVLAGGAGSTSGSSRLQ